MAGATWGGGPTPEIDWRMSAALENVPRGNDDLAEVTSLDGAVRMWLTLDSAYREGAVLTPERPVQMNGALTHVFHDDAIAALADRLSDLGTLRS
ncbi:hypothetical protein FHY05_000014 [Sphingomonas sp. BK580]|nr:hypothetical protein [Sphingomonas sp. BK580]